MSEWRDIATAPRDQTRVLLWGVSHDTSEIGRYCTDTDMSGARAGWQVLWVDGWRSANPSHWMPLPEPPEGQS